MGRTSYECIGFSNNQHRTNIYFHYNFKTLNNIIVDSGIK